MKNKISTCIKDEFKKKSYIHTFLPSIATNIGDSEAILLNQIKYWLSKCGRDISGLQGKWIYNSLKEWHKQFPYWSMHKLRKTIKSLENLGLIKSVKVNCKKWNHTKWYTVDQNKYYELLEEETISSEKEKNITKDLVTLSCNKDIRFSNKTNLESNNITNSLPFNFKKTTNRFVETQQVIITKNNYTNNSSYKENINFIDSLIEKKLEDKLSELIKKGEIIVKKDEECKNFLSKATEKESLSLIKRKNKTDVINSFNKLSDIKEADKSLHFEIKEDSNLENQKDKNTCLNASGKNLSSKKQLIIKTKLTKKNKDNSDLIAIEMTKVWNEVFSYSYKPIKAYINKKNNLKLINLFKYKFNKNMKEWEEYAKQVNQSQFLMGEKETKRKFKAVFSWLIKEETVESIRQGAYGVGDRELDMNNQKDNIKKKTEELVNKVDKKISANIKEIITATKNEEEFEKYIVNKGYKEDNDQYGIEIIADRIPKYNLFNNKEYERIKGHLYEKYIFKKILNVEKPQIRERIRNKLEEKIKSNNSPMVLEELTQQEKKIDSMNFLHNIQNRYYADIMIE